MSIDQAATNSLDPGMYLAGMFYTGSGIMLGMGAAYLLREVRGPQTPHIALAVVIVIYAADNDLGVLGF